MANKEFWAPRKETGRETLLPMVREAGSRCAEKKGWGFGGLGMKVSALKAAAYILGAE